MLNIPTELLRTLVSVVDQRSFTKAAQSLGVTQPAVSAQIKRLQFLLGYEIPRQERAGREPHAAGRDGRRPCAPDAVDQRSDRAAERRPADGADRARRHPGRFCRRQDPGDLGAVSQALAGHSFRRDRDQLREHGARAAPRRHRSRRCHCKFEALDRGASFVDRPGGVGAQRCHAARPQRAGAAGFVRRGLFVPLHRGERAASRSGANATSCSPRAASPAWRPRSSPGSASWCCRAAASLQTALTIWEDAPLPELPQLYCGIYLREGGNRVALEELADEIAAVLRPQLQVKTGGAATRHSCRRGRADRGIRASYASR